MTSFKDSGPFFKRHFLLDWKDGENDGWYPGEKKFQKELVDNPKAVSPKGMPAEIASDARSGADNIRKKRKGSPEYMKDK